MVRYGHGIYGTPYGHVGHIYKIDTHRILTILISKNTNKHEASQTLIAMDTDVLYPRGTSIPLPNSVREFQHPGYTQHTMPRRTNRIALDVDK